MRSAAGHLPGVRLSLAGALAALLAAAPQALGDVPWSSPQTIPGAHLVRWEPVPAGTTSGAALKSFDGQFGFTPGGVGFAVLGRGAGGRGITRFSSSSGTFGSLNSAATAGIAPTQIALYGREGVMLGGQLGRPGDPRSPLNPDIFLDAGVTRGSTSGDFGRRQVLGRGIFAGSAGQAVVTALASNTEGDAATVVSVPVRGKTRVAGFRSRLFIRRRGQSSFQLVTEIGPQTVGHSPAALAVNGPGDVLVAWDDRKRVSARLVTAGGSVRPLQTLGQGGSPLFGQRLVAAMDNTRRMLVAWMAQRIGENSAGGPGTVSLSYAPPYKLFRAPQVVQRDLPRGEGRAITGNAVAATLLRNRGLVVWTGYASGRYAVRSVDVTSGRAGSPVNLSPAGTDAHLQGLAIGPRGGTVAAWSSDTRSRTLPQPPPGLYAVARGADAARWGARETIATTGSQGFLAADAMLAADPLSGQTVLVWSDPLPAGGTAPVPVRYAVRPAG